MYTVETAFEGASQTLRLAQKGLIRGDADTLASRELKQLWARSHHLCRNSPPAVTARNRLVAHWVGTGIKVVWDNKQMQQAWDTFAADPSVDGHGSLVNQEALWASSLFESGEALCRMVIQRGKTSGTVPLKLQAIEAEQLDPLYTDGSSIRQGIEFDSAGLRPLKYHVWKRHPSLIRGTAVNTRVAIPASRMLHMFNKDRAGQWRGIPKLAPAILTIYEMDELTDATLVRQKAAQAVGWIIEKTGPGPLPLLGGMETPVGAEQADPAKEEQRIQKIVSGGIHYLQGDETVRFADISDIGANFVSLLDYNWRMIASCLDLTYEQLTGDLSKANFGSLRAGAIEFRKRVTLTQQLVFMNLGLIPLTAYFKELASVYVSKKAGASRCSFIVPKQEWLDPLKDVQADVLEVRSGLATLRKKLQERGVADVEAHIAQILEEQNYGIILTSNPKNELKTDSSSTSREEK